MRNKQMRQTRIRELLFAEAIDTHEKLAEVLEQQGIEVSQSTLSKDLRELGVVRVPQAIGGFRYTLPDSGATMRDRHILDRELQDFLVQAEQAANLVIVRTLSGHAQSVCEAIDRIGWNEAAGTIAGENTIFIATRSDAEATAVVDKISAVCGEGD
ncbi:MAG TPA: arginine repressor [Candidatus Latescibacteria bacterium]|nr:arginine repressor [Candidatus Handelsmanbacteria bacterium]HIL09713.1 arginine repressor [Candidatus Latescibacterota bacterium]